MRKIFSILVVLMMVAGTFVSCNMPTNDSTGTGTVRSDITPEGYPVHFVEGNDQLCIIKYRDVKFWCTKAAGDILNGKIVSDTFSDVAQGKAPYYEGLAIKGVGLSNCHGAVTSNYIIYKLGDFEPTNPVPLKLGNGNTKGSFTYNGEEICYQY